MSGKSEGDLNVTLRVWVLFAVPTSLTILRRYREPYPKQLRPLVARYTACMWILQVLVMFDVLADASGVHVAVEVLALLFGLNVGVLG